jgi:hypothetical protein
MDEAEKLAEAQEKFSAEQWFVEPSYESDKAEERWETMGVNRVIAVMEARVTTEPQQPELDLVWEKLKGPLHAPVLAPPPDVDTSAKALKEIKADGTLGKLQQAVLSYVRRFPGKTAHELDDMGGTQDYHKRLPELRAKGLVKNGDKRNCRLTGKLAQTWWPT